MLLWVRQHQQCLVVLGVCLAVVAMVWVRSSRYAEFRLARTLDQSATMIAESIEQHFRAHERLLHISRALFDASDDVTREDWEIFVEQLALDENTPGVLALGFVQRVEAGELADFVRQERANGAPDFRVRPHRHADVDEPLDVLYIIKYSGPAERNRHAWGVDVATNGLNRQTYDRSAAAGETRIATGFPLTQAGEDSTGMVMALPVYHRRNHREGELHGWVTTAVVLERFLESAWDRRWDGFLVSIETDEAGRTIEMAASNLGAHGSDPTLAGRRDELVRELDLFGRTIRVRIDPAAPELVRADMSDARLLLLLGLMASALLTLITWTATRTRQHAVAIARQMTESLRMSEQRQRELARRADEANHAKSEFLANMSHEIRTPMTAILGYADIVESPETEDRTRDEAVAAIRRAGRHLLTIINDVLDISKIESGHMQIVEEQCDLPALLREVLNGLQPQAAAKGLDLHAELDGSIPTAVRTDTHRVRQILINLVGNAVKFTDHGSVRMRIQHADETLSIEVSDTGNGIHKSKLEAIFQPFEQADNSSSRRYEGTGLGLTISRRLAGLLGGTLCARSTVGVGSSFTLTIPAPACEGTSERIRTLDAAPPHTRHALPTPASAAPSDDAPIRGRVLLAEDGPDNQHLISFILRRAGLEVEVVSNGRQAVERFDAGERYDLFITDMQMPELDGYETARILREDGHTLPILALTAHAMEGDRERCIQAGCDDYETKPINRASLLGKIRALLGEAADDRRAA
ncbi:MAG: CHASE domain-containing protein [Phycisphaerales bacterium]|nr:CHASE domain-containing protein [Phycisphaerales bacterium]